MIGLHGRGHSNTTNNIIIFSAIGDYNGHVGLGVKCSKEVLCKSIGHVEPQPVSCNQWCAARYVAGRYLSFYLQFLALSAYHS